jgi:hypothetical protein
VVIFVSVRPLSAAFAAAGGSIGQSLWGWSRRSPHVYFQEEVSPLERTSAIGKRGEGMLGAREPVLEALAYKPGFAGKASWTTFACVADVASGVKR